MLIIISNAIRELIAFVKRTNLNVKVDSLIHWRIFQNSIEKRREKKKSFGLK